MKKSFEDVSLRLIKCYGADPFLDQKSVATLKSVAGRFLPVTLFGLDQIFTDLYLLGPKKIFLIFITYYTSSYVEKLVFLIFIKENF